MIVVVCMLNIRRCFGKSSLKKRRQFWVIFIARSCFRSSFLDGMQRVILFTECRNLAENATNIFEIIQQEITLSLHGFGLSLVNNLTRQEIMYIGIASSGIIWETCKLDRRRFKPLGTSGNKFRFVHKFCCKLNF